MKICTKCDIKKDLKEFSSNGKSIRSRCKLCINVINRTYFIANKDKSKQYYIDNRERVLHIRRIYVNTHKEEIKIKKKEYAKLNLTKLNIRNAKRRAAKLNATPKWLTSFHIKQIESIYKLAKTIQNITGTEYQVDHIVPLQNEIVVGLHVPWNLQIVTANYNKSKGNKV